MLQAEKRDGNLLWSPNPRSLLKIALIHFTAPPVPGGVERVVGEQIQLLRKNGHHVSLACFEGGGHGLVDAFIPLSREATRTDFVSYLGTALSCADCVLFHNVGTMPFAPELTHALQSLARSHTQTRWICWVHDLALGNPDYPYTRPGGDQPYANACEAWEYVAISPLRAREVTKHFRVPCRVVPNGIDPAETLQLSASTAATAEALGCWDADYVLINPSRLLPRKLLETGIRMTDTIQKAGINLKYLITGAADPHNPIHLKHSTHLKSVVEELQLGSCVFFLNDLAPVGPRELCDFYQIADAVFLSGDREGFGLPALEAGAFGKPLFCPDVEPLNTLPGALTYPSGLSIVNLAAWLLRQLGGRDTILARRQIFRTYRWSSIYRNYLAPLLARPTPFQ